jgi:hypothetical protein
MLRQGNRVKNRHVLVNVLAGRDRCLQPDTIDATPCAQLSLPAKDSIAQDLQQQDTTPRFTSHQLWCIAGALTAAVRVAGQPAAAV